MPTMVVHRASPHEPDKMVEYSVRWTIHQGPFSRSTHLAQQDCFYLAVLVSAICLLLPLVCRGVLVRRVVVGIRVVANADAGVVDVALVLVPPVQAKESSTKIYERQQTRRDRHDQTLRNDSMPRQRCPKLKSPLKRTCKQCRGGHTSRGGSSRGSGCAGRLQTPSDAAHER